MRLGKIFKNKITSNISWMLFASIGQMIISLIVNSISARYLGPSNYGIIQYVSSFVSMFSPVCQLGLYSIVIKELVAKKFNNGEILGSALFLRVIIGFVSTTAIVFLTMALKNNDRTYIFCAILCGTKLVFDAFEVFKYWFQSNLAAKKVTIITLIAYCGMSAFRIMLLILKSDIYLFSFATTLDSILIAIGYIIVYKKDKVGKLKLSKSCLKTLLSQSKNLLISAIIGGVAAQINTIMLGNYLDEAFVGYYHCIVVCCTQVGFVFSALVDTFRPVIMDSYNVSKEKFERNLSIVISIIAILFLMCAVLLSVFSNFVVKILYGKDYLQAAKYMPFYAVGYFTSFFGVVRTIWFVSTNNLKYERTISLIFTSISIVMSWLLIKYLGLLGAFINYMATQILMHVISNFFFKPTRCFLKIFARGILFKDMRDFKKFIKGE